MADHFKKSRSHIIVKILRRQFLLSRTQEPIPNVGCEFASQVSCNSMDKHSPILPSALAIYAAKSCIHILIVSLKPIAKRRPEHARGGARRSTFQNEVLAVKKIG